MTGSLTITSHGHLYHAGELSHAGPAKASSVSTLGVQANEIPTLIMQLGSNCGATYLQAETAFVSVRTGTAKLSDVCCTVSQL